MILLLILSKYVFYKYLVNKIKKDIQNKPEDISIDISKCTNYI